MNKSSPFPHSSAPLKKSLVYLEDGLFSLYTSQTELLFSGAE